jgi:hypothetical protein
MLHRELCCVIFLAAMCGAAIPTGLFQGCTSCCGAFDVSNRCSTYYCPWSGCCSESINGFCFSCGDYVSCVEWNPPIEPPPATGYAQSCKETFYNPPPPPVFVDTVSTSSNYWTACSGQSITLRGDAFGAVWDGSYGTVSTVDASALLVAKSANVTRALVGGTGVSTVRGLVVFLALHTSSNVAVWGTANTVNITGGNVTVSLEYGALVTTIATNGNRPTLRVNNTIGSLVTNGATTVLGAGRLDILAHDGGTVTSLTGSTIGLLLLNASTTAVIAGAASTVSIVGANVTLTLAATAIVGNLSAGNNTPRVYVGNTIGHLRSNGVTTVQSNGIVVNLTHDGGDVVVAPGGVVETLTGFGNFTISGEARSIIITTGPTSVSIMPGSGGVTTVEVASNVSLLELRVNGGRVLSAVVRGDLAASGSSGEGGTVALSVLPGGAVRAHAVAGGTLLVNNSGGIVELIEGYGRFDIVHGDALTLTTRGNTTSVVTVRGGALIDCLVVNGTDAVVVVEGTVERFVVLEGAVSVSITLLGNKSRFGALDASAASGLVSMFLNASSAHVGGIDLAAGQDVNITVVYSNVTFEAVAGAGPLLRIATQSRSVTLTVSDSHLASAAAPLIELAGVGGAEIVLRGTNVTITDANCTRPVFELPHPSPPRGDAAVRLDVAGGTWTAVSAAVWVRVSCGSDADCDTSVSIVGLELLARTAASSATVFVAIGRTDSIPTNGTESVVFSGRVLESVVSVQPFLAGTPDVSMGIDVVQVQESNVAIRNATITVSGCRLLNVQRCIVVGVCVRLMQDALKMISITNTSIVIAGLTMVRDGQEDGTPAVAFALALLACVWLAARRASVVAEALAVLLLPSSLLPVWLASIPSTAAAAALLASHLVGSDGALAVRSACAIDGSQLVGETPATLDWRLSNDDDGFDAPAAPHDYDHLFWDESGHAIVRSNETEDDTVTQRQLSEEGAVISGELCL